MQYIIVYPGNVDSPDTQSAKVEPDTGAGKYACQRLKTRPASCAGLSSLALRREVTAPCSYMNLNRLSSRKRCALGSYDTARYVPCGAYTQDDVIPIELPSSVGALYLWPLSRSLSSRYPTDINHCVTLGADKGFMFSGITLLISLTNIAIPVFSAICTFDAISGVRWNSSSCFFEDCLRIFH